MRQETNYIIICPFQYNSGDRGIDPRLKMAGAIDLLSGRRKILSDVFSQRFKSGFLIGSMRSRGGVCGTSPIWPKFGPVVGDTPKTH